MRLHRVVLFGFKTFASRSEVIFDRGITAVVGPNGSGKSNLVDAMRWALGETNARELRGQRMDEVIYAGGGSRKRVALAEVELVIDNEEGRLPVDDPEVSVGRRVARGERDTEFRINGARARLLDLERLLGATGLTQNGYAVVVQNDIDGIIEATPSQRRALVEQAAGVRSLRAASEDALRRLRGAEIVVRRLTDLRDDAEPRLAELEVQAESARELRGLSERLTELRGSLAREEWRAARASLKLAKRRFDQASARCEAAAEAEMGFSVRARSERERLDAARAARDAARRVLETARLDVELAEAARRRHGDRLRSAVGHRAVAAAETTSLSAELVLAEEERRTADRLATGRAGAELEADVEGLLEALAAAEADALTASDRHGQTLAELAAAEAAHVAALGSERDAIAQSRRDADAVRQLEQESEAAAGRVAALRSELAGHAGAAERANAAAASAEAEVDQVRNAVERCWEAVNETEAAAATSGTAARAALERLAAARGRLSGATSVDGAVATAITAGTLRGRRLAECLTVRDPDVQTAVAAALETHLGDWLVDDLAAASALLGRGGPREGLLQAGLDPLAPAVIPAPWIALSDQVLADQSARGAVDRLLCGSWLAPDIASARAALVQGARTVVLRDGTVVSEAGLRAGRPVDALELVIAEREAAAGADRATALEGAAIVAVTSARERLAESERELAERTDAAQERRSAATTAGLVYGAARDGLHAAIDRVERARAQLAERRTALPDSSTAAGTAGLPVNDAAARVDAARAAATGAEQALELARAAAGAAASAAGEAQLAVARMRAESAHADERISTSRRALDLARTRIGAAENRLLGAETDALLAMVRARTAGLAALRARASVVAAQSGTEDAGRPLAELEHTVLALEAEHADVAVAVARAEDERTAAGREVETGEALVAAAAASLREGEDDDAPDADAGVAERAEREIVRIERRIGALGAVNALAPEQHDALRTRVAGLSAHRDDLATACSLVQTMAHQLETEIERRFDSVFGAVTVHFQQLFADLFPGGRATLRLEETPPPEDNADEPAARRPGVEILAQPAGKRLGPLRLLSGGERALTALAMVLAMQQVNPSPFYVFDEVDAALDDANVLRFTRLLRRLAENQQFIVVTHNHITMAAADALWGVTIDSDGVSSVLSVRFDEAARATVPTIHLEPVSSRAG